MMAYVDLVLHVQVGPGQESQQLGNIGRELVPEIRLDQGVGVKGRGGRRVGRSGRQRGSIRGGRVRRHQGLGGAQEDLAPQPFPTQSSRSAALCSTVQVGRLQT